MRTTTTFPVWSKASPENLYFTSDEDGSLQVWIANVSGGERHRLTEEPVGVERIMAVPSGSGVAWWRDRTGNESGRWMITDLDGGTRPMIPEAPGGWSDGAGFGGATAVAAISDPSGYRVWVSRDREPAHKIAESATPIGIGREFEYGWNGVSADGGLVCVRVATGRDITRASLRILDTRTGAEVTARNDPGHHLRFSAWSPIEGDHRLVIAHEREGWIRPAVWDAGSGEVRDLSITRRGQVDVVGWYPDATALLAIHVFQGRSTLLRIDAGSGETELLLDPTGWISGAAVRPDGAVWARTESATQGPVVGEVGGEAIAALAPTSDAPAGRAYRSLHFEDRDGVSIHTFVVTPDGAGPFPTVLAVHGGPDWAYSDAFDPEIQAFADHGFAVAMINYRGSLGYGVAFADALRGNYAFPELADILDGLDMLVAQGITDPDRVAIQGWSWGGYLSLLAAGMHPERFAAVMGGIPVADSIACHEDANPAQQAWDIAMLGGSPTEIPEVYRERSPITYVDQVHAPILIIAGENDTACPIRQIRNYVGALETRGAVVETLIYEAGHHELSVSERIRFTEHQLAFFHEHIPGVPAPS